MNARADMLGRIRQALGREGLEGARAEPLEARLARHRAGLIPVQGRPAPERLVEQFVAKAEAVQTSIARIGGLADLPAAIAEYLARENLPARFALSPDTRLDGVPWASRPLLTPVRGKPAPDDLVGVAAAVAAVAETGTLVLLSGADKSSTMNFLPDTEIVVLPARAIAGALEEVWRRLREAGAMARTVNLVTGPSRTGDIEQKILLGAHGPRRLHVVIVDDLD
jgi:L-lactate dehydrogenase complex protein LldG